MYADLHAHTTASDGVLTPVELVGLARARGLAVLAVTDHDSVAGVAEAWRAAPDGLRIVPGVELSCRVDGREAHILGYGFDPEEPGLRSALAKFAEARRVRGRRMVERLQGHGVDIEFEDVERMGGSGSIGRPHVARALVECGAVDSVDEAFSRWLRHGAAAFVDKPRLDPAEACDLVKSAGGVPGLAHPGTFRRDDLIPVLVEAGLEALEVRHTEHSAARTRHYEAMAARMRLLPTGGSDFHGTRGHRSRLGRPRVPQEWAADLVARAGSRH